jgi:1-acyl-sn-glycerol-3-phosphate acyltransferase
MPGGPTLRARAARALLGLLGWRVDVVPLPGPKGVIIVYPHTSNWDFPLGYLAKMAAGLRVKWVGKDSLFRWPLGGLLRRMGGIPVNRRERTGLVEQLRREMDRRDEAWLVIAPEGTRSFGDHWKSGFWHIALAAGVPVGLAFIDYPRRSVGLRTYLRLTGDPEVDLEAMRRAYEGKVGLHPELAGTIRFREGDGTHP